MTGEGHKWSVAGEFRAPPGNGSSEGVGGSAVGWKLLVNQREPLETESGVGNSEVELRKWTRVRLGRRT